MSKKEWYRMVCVSICEHASSVFVFESMRTVCLFLRARAFVKFYLQASSTLEKYRWRAASAESTS